MRLIRQYINQQPSLPIEEVRALIEKLEPDGANLDLEASMLLHEIVEPGCPLNGKVFYQSCIKAVLVNYHPVWARAMQQGRKRFVGSLNQNDQDIFEAAGLLIDPPPMEMVLWWDMVVGHARLGSDLKKMLQAREAEQNSIEYEKNKLLSLGIERDPVWIGLDDNFAGYDVLSFELIDNKIVHLMIEVKSTIASPLRFILTRHEWEKAEELRNAYRFHVWDMKKSPVELFALTVDQIRPHIPSDNEKGKWKQAEILLSVNA